MSIANTLLAVRDGATESFIDGAVTEIYTVDQLADTVLALRARN